jgi:hypothetical protein
MRRNQRNDDVRDISANKRDTVYYRNNGKKSFHLVFLVEKETAQLPRAKGGLGFGNRLPSRGPIFFRNRVSAIQHHAIQHRATQNYDVHR